MRNLIRHILKEETDDSETLNKGINLAIKILKKSYPYIIGWKLIELSIGRFAIGITVICDIEKLKEFYNSDLSDYHKRNKNELSNEDYPYAVSILNIRNEMTSDEMFEDYKKLKQELNDIYEMLPEHLTAKDEFNDVKTLDPDRFEFR
jgi:hypothetical protein